MKYALISMIRGEERGLTSVIHYDFYRHNINAYGMKISKTM